MRLPAHLCECSAHSARVRRVVVSAVCVIPNATSDDCLRVVSALDTLEHASRIGEVGPTLYP
jgi:hypothetical protein